MTAVLPPPINFQGFTQNGTLNAFGFVATYAAGSTTPIATYTDATQSQVNPNPVPLNAIGQAAIWLSPGTGYKFVETDQFGNQCGFADQINASGAGVTSNLVPAINNVFNIGSPTLQWANGYFGGSIYINGVSVFQGQTAAEIAVGAVVVNPQYPPMYWDRYGTNSGSAYDSAPMASTAWKVAQVAGGRVRAGATAPYYTMSPINYSNSNTGQQYGIHFIMETGPAAASFIAPSIIANHTGHVFDMTGTIFAVMEDVCVGTGALIPQTCFFQARTSNNNSVGITRFLHCSFVGTTQYDAYYNYGAEDDAIENCYWHMAGSNSNACIAYTGNNIRNLSSTFQAVATGNQSCIDHKIFGGEIYNASSSISADSIRIEQSDSVKIYGPWMYCASALSNGRSLIYVDLTNAASSFCNINGVTGEQAAFLQQYGIFFSNAVNTGTPSQYTPTGWCIEACKLSNSGNNSIATGGTNTVLDNFLISNINNASTGNNVFVQGTLQNSIVNLTTASTLAIGTSTRNSLTGDTSKFTIGTRNFDSWTDIGSANKTIATVPSSGISSSAGALIARARLSITGSCLIFNVVLASSSGNLTIAVNSTITLIAPGGQSLAPSDIGECNVTDQAAGTSIGGAVTASGNNALITIPAGVAATSHTIIVSGTVFLA